MLLSSSYDIAKCQNARGKKTLVEREFGLATILGIINQYGGRIRSFLRLNECPESKINL